MNDSVHVATAGAPRGSPAGSPLVGAPLLPTMMRLAVPGVLGAMIQMLLIVVEAWFLSRAGTTALAAVATVFPLVMLANMLSAGAAIFLGECPGAPCAECTPQRAGVCVAGGG